MTELRRPEVLAPAEHDRSRFDSGAPVLDDWLRRFTGQSRRRDTGATWVVTDGAGEVMAFASVAMTGIDRPAVPQTVARQALDPIPGLLLARLAVDRRVQGLGVGTALVAHVLSTAVELNTKAACRAVLVNAVDGAARSWWERLGFRPFDPADPSGLDLYLLTTKIEATLRARR